MYRALSSNSFHNVKGKLAIYREGEIISDEEFSTIPESLKFKFQKVGTVIEQKLERLERQQKQV